MPRAIELAGTEHHEFVTAEGKAYTLDVGLPPDYESDSDVTYPVLYVLDGELMFHHVRSSYELLDTLPLTVGVPVEALEQGGFIGTPLIIVGIDQKGSHSGRASVASARESGSMRTFDLTPTRSTKQEARFLESYGRESPTGGAASFLAALKDEIFSVGSISLQSIGSKRSLRFFARRAVRDARAPHGTTFDRYLIGSPSLWWDNEGLVDFWKTP